MVASQNGHVEVVDQLLQHGASVNVQEEVSFIYHNTYTTHEIHPTCRMEPVRCL